MMMIATLVDSVATFFYVGCFVLTRHLSLTVLEFFTFIIRPRIAISRHMSAIRFSNFKIRFRDLAVEIFHLAFYRSEFIQLFLFVGNFRIMQA